MHDDSLPDSLEQSLRTTRIIVLAMLAGVIGLGGTGAVLIANLVPPGGDAAASPVREAFYLTALASVLASVALRRLLTSGRFLTQPMSADALARRFQLAHIVGAALAEIPAPLGLAYVLVFDHRLSTLATFFGVSFLALLMCLPSRFHLQELAELYLQAGDDEQE